MINHLKKHEISIETKPKKLSIIQNNKLDSYFEACDTYQSQTDALFIQWIIMDDQAFYVAGNEYLRRFVAHLNSKYNLPHRDKTKTLIDTKAETLFTVWKKIIEKLVEEGTYFGATLDHSTAESQNKNFLDINIQWLTKEFELLNAVILFKSVKRQIGVTLRSDVLQAFEEWGITKAVKFVTVDGCARKCLQSSVSPNAEEEAEGIEDVSWQYPTHWCVAHKINICISTAIKESAVGPIITIFRSAVIHITGSPLRWAKFADFAKGSGHTVKCMEPDTKIRWTSLHTMVDQVLHNKPPLVLYLDDIDYEIPPTSDQWITLQQMAEFTQPFYETLIILQGQTPETLGYTYPLLNKLRRILETPVSAPDIRSLQKAMLKQWDEKFPAHETLKDELMLATILTPSLKDLKGFSEQDVTYTKRLLKNRVEQEKPKRRVVRRNTTGTSNTGSSNITNQTNVRQTSSILKDITNDDTTPIAANDEVKIYLESKINSSVKFTDYWKGAPNYPLLKKVVRTVFILPPTSCFAERCFSTSGNIITDSRNKLGEKTASNLIILKKNTVFENDPSYKTLLMEVKEGKEK